MHGGGGAVADLGNIGTYVRTRTVDREPGAGVRTRPAENGVKEQEP